MFVPFYQIYWFYKHGQRIDAMSRQKKLSNSDMATLCVILGIFIPTVACILMQDLLQAAVQGVALFGLPRYHDRDMPALRGHADGGVVWIVHHHVHVKAIALIGLARKAVKERSYRRALVFGRHDDCQAVFLFII